jgi:hypothetical protein
MLGLADGKFPRPAPEVVLLRWRAGVAIFLLLFVKGCCCNIDGLESLLLSDALLARKSSCAKGHRALSNHIRLAKLYESG